MKKPEKKSLFTAINQEESATIRGGSNITISGDIAGFIGLASQFIDIKMLQEQLAASKTNS